MIFMDIVSILNRYYRNQDNRNEMGNTINKNNNNNNNSNSNNNNNINNNVGRRTQCIVSTIADLQRDIRGIAVDSKRHDYVACSSHEIVQVMKDGSCITLAGCNKRGFKDGPPNEAMVDGLFGMTISHDNKYLYVAD